ncbi:hypothetical protein, partial [Frankia sp. Cas3]|uniref:hypothetical protein n=1 Tax=Frankia sp. Cas3 TaxID=3073926 RepID=UPI002AD3EB4A
RQSEAGLRADALAGFADAARNLPAGPAAELTVRRAFWQSAHDSPDGARADLQLAARLSDEEQQPAAAGRARRAIRDAVGELLPPGGSAAVDDARAQLPDWATHPVPDTLIALVNQWSQTAAWPEQEEFLRQQTPTVGDPAQMRAVAVLRALYPDHAALANLEGFLHEIQENGLDATLASHRSAWEFQQLLQGWITTPTWEASRRYLTNHPELAADPRTTAVLASAPQDPTAAQHLAILNLTATRSVDDVYDAVTDPAVAHDEAMAAVSAGDATTVANLLLAAPALARLAFTGPFLAAAYGLLIGGGDVPRFIEAAAAAGNAVQRVAAAARLRRLARTHPQHADAVSRILPILEAEPATEAGDDTGHAQ